MDDVQRLDLKALIKYIDDQKELKANLILDEGCALMVQDAKPLVKALNYIFNYLTRLTNHPLQISLDLMHDQYLLSFLAYTQTEEFPPLSEELQAILAEYNARYELLPHPGSYVQIKIHFDRPQNM